MGLLDTTKEVAKIAAMLANPELVQMAMKANIEALELSQTNLQLQQDKIRLQEQLKEANAKLTLVGEVIRIGHYVYYKEGDDGACCPRCFDVETRMVHISLIKPIGATSFRWGCPDCKMLYQHHAAVRAKAAASAKQEAANGVG